VKPSPLPLTTAPLPERERADARRNRERILRATARLVDEHGIDRVSMDDVASAAAWARGPSIDASAIAGRCCARSSRSPSATFRTR
jgi:hypothetical protein